MDGLLSQVVRYWAEDGVAVQFEIEPIPGFQPASHTEVIGQVKAAVAPAVKAAQAVLEQARVIAPDQLQVKFGIKVTGTANWLVAKAATEGSFEVTLSWTSNHSSKPEKHVDH